MIAAVRPGQGGGPAAGFICLSVARPRASS
jgi:hypothetical protein